MVRDHRPGKAVSEWMLPGDIELASRSRRFRPFSQPGGACWRPPQVGPYVIRGTLPAGMKLMPHRRPRDRIYTVIFAAVFYIGLDNQFNSDEVKAYSCRQSLSVCTETHGTSTRQYSADYVAQVTSHRVARRPRIRRETQDDQRDTAQIALSYETPSQQTQYLMR